MLIENTENNKTVTKTWSLIEAELSARLKRDAEAEAALAKKKAENKTHQTAVNNSILASLTALGISEQQAKLIICCVADGDIKFLEIRY